MMARPGRQLVQSHPHADVDAAFQLPANARTRDVWDAWAFAAIESGLALGAWLSAEPGDRELGYLAYLACLDREEQAAMVLAERVDPPAAARLRATG
jgi:hypothetical protein